MFVVKFKAWLHNVGCCAIINNGFDLMLPVTEGNVLKLTKDDKKAKWEALKVNYRAINCLLLALKTVKTMNEVTKEQAEDASLPGWKFTKSWA
jgi:hypothetical protein